MAASISRRLLGVSTTIAGITLMAAAIATISTVASTRGSGRRSMMCPPRERRRLLRLGLTAVLVGGAILAFLYLLRHWPSAQPMTADTGDRAEMSPALMLFGAYLAALPFLFVAAAAPAIRFARVHRALGSDPFGGFGLMVPVFETLLTVGLFIGAVAVVGLVPVEKRSVPQVIHRPRRFSARLRVDGVRGHRPGIGRDRSACVRGTAHSRAPDSRSNCGPQPDRPAGGQRSLGGVPDHVAARGRTVCRTTRDLGTAIISVHDHPHTLVLLVEEPRREADATIADNAPRYAVRANYVAGILGGALEAVDLNGPAVLSATLGPMTGHIQVYSSERVVRQIVRATRHRYFTSWPAYEVAASEYERLGGMKKISRTEWRILDTNGREIGSIDQGAASTGKAKYRAHIGNTPVCTFAWSNVLMPELVLDCSPHAERLLDGRFALACAMALFVDVCPSA